MRKRDLLLILGTGALAILLSGCGANWQVTDPKFFRYENHDVRVAGIVQMTGKAHQLVGTEKGADFELRLYDDGYNTQLYETKQRLGIELEQQGDETTKQVFELPVTDVRLGGTDNSYPVFCAEVRMDDSNVSDWVQVGCVHYTDPPLDTPSGGLGADIDSLALPRLD